MLEGVVIRNTPLLKSSFIDDGRPIRQKVHFWTINGINESLANPGRAPILRTKSVTKKEMNKSWQKYMILAGFEPGLPG